jgi:hypothetical protein
MTTLVVATTPNCMSERRPRKRQRVVLEMLDDAGQVRGVEIQRGTLSGAFGPSSAPSYPRPVSEWCQVLFPVPQNNLSYCRSRPIAASCHPSLSGPFLQGPQRTLLQAAKMAKAQTSVDTSCCPLTPTVTAHASTRCRVRHGPKAPPSAFPTFATVQSPAADIFRLGLLGNLLCPPNCVFVAI